MTEAQLRPGSRMEFQKESLWVGLFVLTAIVAFAALTAVAVHKRFFRREYTLHTSVPRIEGLRPGAEVLMRGHVVGLVREITLTTSPEISFGVDFSVEEEVKLPIGTKVRLSSSLAATALDLVTPGDPVDPDAPPALPEGKRGLVLEPGSSLPGFVGPSLDALFMDLYGLTGQLTRTLEGTDLLLRERLGPRLEEALAQMTSDLGRITAELETTLNGARDVLGTAGGMLEENRPRLAMLLDSAGRDLEAVETLTRRLEGMLGTVETRAGPLLDDISSSVEQADSLMGRMESALDEEKIGMIIDNLATASTEADLLVKELRKRPWRLLRRVRGEKEDLIRALEAQRDLEEGNAAGEPPEPPREE